MKGSFLRFVFIISIIFNISIIATAGYIVYKHRFRGSRLSEMSKRERFIFEKISLRPDQIKALNEKSAAFSAEIEKKRDEIMRERKALLSLLRDDSAGKEAIDGEISRISNVQEDIQRAAAAHILEEKSLLDRDQQKQFFDLLERSLSERRHGRRGPSK